MNDDLHDEREENLADGVLDADDTGMVQSQVDITMAQIEENAIPDDVPREAYDELVEDDRTS